MDVEAVQVQCPIPMRVVLAVDLSKASADVERRVLNVAVNQPIVQAEVTALGEQSI